VAKGIHDIEDPALRVQAATDLMSRSGFRMIALFEQGPEKIRSLAQELAQLGGTVSTEEAAMGEKWAMMEARFDAAWTGIKKAVAEPIFQFMIEHAGELTTGLKEVTTWLRDGVGAAMEYLGPVIESAFEVARSAAEILGPIVIPMLQIVSTLLKGIAEALKLIESLLKPVLDTMGSALHAVSEGFAEIFGSGSQAGGQPVGSGAGGGGGGVQIGQVNLGPVDADAATSQLAAKLQPTIRQAVLDQYRQLGATFQHGGVASKLGGNAPSHHHSGL